MMSDGNGNVKWTSLVIVAVSLLGIFTTVSIFAFGQGVAIDTRAREGIEKVDGKSNARFTENRQTLMQVMKENSEAHLAIMGDLREIKAKIGIYNDGRTKTGVGV